jgi:hypothetical protein
MAIGKHAHNKGPHGLQYTLSGGQNPLAGGSKSLPRKLRKLTFKLLDILI